LKDFKYSVNGIGFEKDAWIVLQVKFQVLEEFWKLFVVPMTNRILNDSEKSFNDHREDVDIKIKKIGITNFTILFNIFMAKKYLDEFHGDILQFQYFYIHLGIVCDLIKSLIFRVMHLLEYLDNQEVIDLRININNLKNYINDFVNQDECKCLNYASSRELLKPILGRFFNSRIIEDYLKFSKSISDYRNIIIHQAFVSFIEYKGKYIFPKRETIDSYKTKLHEEYEIAKMTDEEKIRDFIIVDELLNEDFNNLSIIINNIFSKLIEKFRYAFFVEKNQKILNFYNVTVE
jgi:hypothetical protein